MTQQPTCEERIADQLAGRLGQIRTLQNLANYQPGNSLSDIEADQLAELGWTSDDANDQPERVNDDATQALAELPLCVSSQTVFRIDLSTGGPGDWLEIRCSGDTPAYEGGEGAYEIQGASYHFNDWFDHAERELHGDELETVEAFAQSVVPELVN